MLFSLKTDQNQLKKMILSSQASFPSSYAFNFLPSRYIHEEWLRQIFGDVYDDNLRTKILKSPFADTRLNRLILKKFGLKGQYCYDFDSFARRLALMPNQDLVKIVKIIGMIPYVDDLKKIIDGKDVKKIRSCIGNKEYRFLIKRLPFLLSEKLLLQMRRLKIDTFDINKLEDQSFNNGINCLLIWIHSEPLSVSQRIRLKFKVQTSWEIHESFKAINIENVEMMFKKTISEVLPAWRHLFA